MKEQAQHTVLVLNQYALPRSQPGGTRHIDLFGRLKRWRPRIVAAARNHATQDCFVTDDSRFHLVQSLGYEGNGIRRILGWLLYVVKATGIGLRNPGDVVYASSPHLLTLVAGMIVSRLRRRPLVVEVRDLWPESLVSAGALPAGSWLHRILTRVERSAYAAAAHIVVVTPGWEEHLHRLGVALNRVTVIPNGCERSDFDSPDTLEMLRSGLGLPAPVAVFAGSHGPKDGIHLIIDAAVQLPTVSFLLMGDGSIKHEQQSRVAQLGLVNVHFRDPVAKCELGNVLRACDVGIHTVTPLGVFDSGMSPNKIFDYMACGLPVASNARGPLAQLFADGQCGVLGEPDDLARCIVEVLEAPGDQRQAWLAESRRMLDSKFSRDAQARLLENVLNQTLQRDAGRCGR